jgi:glutamate racemase
MAGERQAWEGGIMSQQVEQVECNGCPELVERVEQLIEDVKALASKLAASLAMRGFRSGELQRLEPELIRLVNSTSKAVRELEQILESVRNRQGGDTHNKFNAEELEAMLSSILDQCRSVRNSLSGPTLH